MNKITILFLLEKVKINKQGKCPIKCRITYLGKRKPFATGLFINPTNWNSALQQAKPPNEENTFTNTQLSLIKQKINQAFLFLQVQGVDFEVNAIYNQYAGVKTNVERGIVEIFNLHISKQEKLIGISTTKVSVAKFYQTKKHLISFIKFQFKRNDYLLKELKMNFILDFEYYLKVDKKFKQHTVYKTIQRFRQMVKLAVGLDYLLKDPFLLHKNSKPKKEVIYLTPKELKALEEYEFASTRLEQVRDMFVFCCYTGLAYNEMSKLTDKQIETGFDGNRWLNIIRQKTNKKYAVPLLNKANEILEKYNHLEQILPIISNQRFNSYLKEIAEIVGIEKNLTHHIARKTFATTILLYNDVPMEIVSELLGHSEIGITQSHYAKVVQSKVSEHMINLGKKLDKK